MIEFRVPPDVGAYTMLSHAVGLTIRGAIGLLVADRNADTSKVVYADGPNNTEDELTDFKENATRIMSPFKAGTPDIALPAIYGNDTKNVTVQIIGSMAS